MRTPVPARPSQAASLAPNWALSGGACAGRSGSGPGPRGKVITEVSASARLPCGGIPVGTTAKADEVTTMIFHQYQLSCLSLFSYLVGDESTGRAVIVDPQRDVSQYLADAEAAG